METTIAVSIITSLLFSAFFSGMEIAFISADRLHVELESKKGILSGEIVSKFINNTSRFISTTLVGNTLSLVLYGIYMAKFLDPIARSSLPDILLNEPFILFLQTTASTIVVLFTAEFLPKSIFMINPNRMLTVFALPMDIIYRIMYPLVILVVSCSKFIITKVMRRQYEEGKPAFRLTDLNNYIKNTLTAGEENNVELDTEIFNNALEFKKIRTRECMLPRTEIKAVEVSDPVKSLKKVFIETGHSKILVYKESIDNVIGYCHSLALFKKPKTIEDILTPIIIVPETMLANELMIRFISERKSLALVVDEFGGTSGIVSIEDIIEEIFGEIEDEHDEQDWIEQKTGENTFLLSARLEIDYLNDKYKWELPVGDYETLGGLILSLTEDLPAVGFVVKHGNYTFTIQSVEDIRIDTIKLSIGNTG